MAARSWTTYEEVAEYLLNKLGDEFGLRAVEGKQTLPGVRSGTGWEIDAKGIRDADGMTIIVECRRYTTSRDNQKAVAALAWQIMDTGAGGAIHVSPLGLQEGAKRVAAANKVIEVTLNADATPQEFEMRFLDRLKLGLYDEVGAAVTDTLRLRILDSNGALISDEEVEKRR